MKKLSIMALKRGLSLNLFAGQGWILSIVNDSNYKVELSNASSQAINSHFLKAKAEKAGHIEQKNDSDKGKFCFHNILTYK